MAHFAFVKMRRVCVDPLNTCEGRFKTHTLRNNSDGPPGSTNTFYGTDRWTDSRSVQYGGSSCTWPAEWTNEQSLLECTINLPNKLGVRQWQGRCPRWLGGLQSKVAGHTSMKMLHHRMHMQRKCWQTRQAQHSKHAKRSRLDDGRSPWHATIIINN